MAHFTDTFGASAYHGDTIRADVDGFTLIATIHADDDATAPWEREDGHGTVSDWRAKETKGPGELVLSNDRGSCRFYDYAEACAIARRDGWGCTGGKLEGETNRAYAARAAMSDYKRLKAWCGDDWSYVGVSVTVEREGVELVPEYEHALWGIESDAGDYLRDVANEYADEALEAAREKIVALAA
jgi:hypothetical protein